MDEKILTALIVAMQACLENINALKAEAPQLDARALAIAATNLETAMLWLANARQ